mgnify:CR=1 FL=1
MNTAEKELAMAEIMHMFRYQYRDEWAPGHIFDGRSRVWVAVFNDLIKQGFIERKKAESGFQYRWAAQFPMGL